MCDLGLSDWVTIYHIIDNRDLFSDPDSKAQILAVAHICVNNRPDGPIKVILNKISTPFNRSRNYSGLGEGAPPSLNPSRR